MIPKIIHTYYFSLNSNIPYEFKNWLDKLSEMYPDYNIKVWTLGGVRFLSKTNDFVKSTLNNCGRIGYLYLSYYCRFYVVNEHGGFFVDPFTFPDKNLNTIIDNCDSYFEVNGYNNINENFFGSTPGNIMLLSVLDEISNINFINPNQSLNKFCISQCLGKHIKKYVNYDSDLGVESLKGENNCWLEYKLKDLHGEYDIPKKHKPKASIVIPVYNASKYITECLDSIFLQTYSNFEIICVDDGSEDDTKEIILSYNDDRLVYIEKKHSGIVDSLNMGIYRASGDYIIRIDSDDVMLKHRIEYQVNYMDKHPEVDILSCGMKFWHPNNPEADSYCKINIPEVTIESMLGGNRMAHPAICMRRKSVLTLPYLYEDYYKNAEDYKLWLTALSHGLKLRSLPEVVTDYRIHDKQTTRTGTDRMWKSSQLIQNAYSRKNSLNNKLTCIIPFQNEGAEIERTIASIRATSNGVNILLVDDCSTDGFDYKKSANLFGCDYIKTPFNYGVAASRDFGIENCKTEYFVLLDGHMRFYDHDWEVNLINKLDMYPNSIVTGNTLVFNYDIDTMQYSGECNFDYGKIHTRAAYVNVWEDGWIFTGKWTNVEFPGEHPQKTDDVVPISCCMGAVYACNKTFWNKILGLQGLEKWGQDEPYMSIKAWLAGGSVLLMKDWGVSHLYRTESTYIIPSKNRLLNRVFLIYFFHKDEAELNHQLQLFKQLEGENSYNDVMKYFETKKDKLLALKDHFWKNVAVKELDWYLREINEPVRQL